MLCTAEAPEAGPSVFFPVRQQQPAALDRGEQDGRADNTGEGPVGQAEIAELHDHDARLDAGLEGLGHGDAGGGDGGSAEAEVAPEQQQGNVGGEAPGRWLPAAQAVEQPVAEDGEGTGEGETGRGGGPEAESLTRHAQGDGEAELLEGLDEALLPRASEQPAEAATDQEGDGGGEEQGGAAAHGVPGARGGSYRGGRAPASVWLALAARCTGAPVNPFLRALSRLPHDGPVMNPIARTITWSRDGEPLAQASFLGVLWWVAGGPATWARDLPELGGPEGSVDPIEDAQLDNLSEDDVHALVGQAAEGAGVSLVTGVDWKGGVLFAGLTEGSLAEGVEVPMPPGEAEVAARFAALAEGLDPEAPLKPQLRAAAAELQAMLVEDVDAPTDPAAVLLRKLILALRDAAPRANKNPSETLQRVQGTAAAVHERASKADALVEPADLLVATLRWMRAPGGDPLLASRIHKRLEQLAATGDVVALARAMEIGVEKGLGIDGLERIFLRAAPEQAQSLVEAAAQQLRS